MALIDTPKAERDRLARKKCAGWAARTASPYHCTNIECGTYVGIRHVLRAKLSEACIVGSEILGVI